jgi:hypothetical protein
LRNPDARRDILPTSEEVAVQTAAGAGSATGVVHRTAIHYIERLLALPRIYDSVADWRL